MCARRCGLPALVLALAVAAGCGGSSDESRVRETLTRYQQASARQDYRQLCNRVFARALTARVARVGLPCEQALRVKLGTVQAPTLSVLKVKVTGARALALVRSAAAGEPPSTDTIELVMDGGAWRISALAREGPQPPQPQRAGD